MPLARILQILHYTVLRDGGDTQWSIPFPGEHEPIDKLVEILKKQQRHGNFH